MTTPGARPPSRWLEGAVRAASWIRGSRVGAPDGCRWLVAPGRTRDAVAAGDLYHGGAGVILFLLELAGAMGETAVLADAVAGARHLAGRLTGGRGPGLYDGLAGVGFALLEATGRTRDPELRAGATRAVELIEGGARPVGAGVEWDGATDILSGAAGTALFLLAAARGLDRPSAQRLAFRAGARLVEAGTAAGGALPWSREPGDNRTMPNFAHGTAGVAFAIARLAQVGGETVLAKAAEAGARSLIAIADAADGGFRVFHSSPGGRDLYYLSWCHGPAGTVRLFAQLAVTTGHPGWLEWVERGARSIRASGAPDRSSPGYWGNLGRCCGAVGIGELFLDLHRAFGRGEDLAVARRVGDHLLDRAVPVGDGLAWPHAEHRLRPGDVHAQTGLMQGAAGIGLFLLRLDAAERGRDWTLRLPDEPDWWAVGEAGVATAAHEQLREHRDTAGIRGAVAPEGSSLWCRRCRNRRRTLPRRSVRARSGPDSP